MPAPWTCGPYRCVGVSSRASVSRSASPSKGLTTVDQEVRGDRVGLLAGRGDGDVAGAELVARAWRRGSKLVTVLPAAGQDGAEEQQGEPGGGPAVEGRGEAGEPLARSWASGCKDVMAGSVRGDRLAW